MVTTTQCVLKSRSGKYVTVTEPPTESPKLSVRDSQTELYIDIYERVENTQNQVAFSYHCIDNSNYTLKVEGDDLKFQKGGSIPTDPTNLTDHHWFKKTNVGSGSHYALESVKLPSFYLSLKGGNFCLDKDTVYVLSDGIKMLQKGGSTSIKIIEGVCTLILDADTVYLLKDKSKKTTS